MKATKNFYLFLTLLISIFSGIQKVAAQATPDAVAGYCITTDWNYRGTITFTTSYRTLFFRSGAVGIVDFYGVNGKSYDFYTETAGGSNLQFAQIMIYDSTGTVIRLARAVAPNYDTGLNFDCTRSGNYRVFVVTSNCRPLAVGLSFYYRERDLSRPTITNFSPKFGGPGTRVFVQGRNLSTVNEVRINNSFHGLGSAGNFGLDFQTNVVTRTGKIVVVSPNGNDTSAIPFIAMPYNTCTDIFDEPECTGPGLNQLTLGQYTVLDSLTSCNSLNENHVAVDTRGALVFSRGRTYTISFNTTAPAYAGLWFDKDRDGDFGILDYIPLSANASRTRFTGTVTLTQNQTLGDYIARIRTSTQASDIANDVACNTQFNPGHAVDVAITVNQPACPPVPVLNVPSSVVLCQGERLVLKPAPPADGVYYLWSNTSTADSIVVTTSGTYSLRAVAGSCTTQTSNTVQVTVVNIPARPTITAQNGVSVICGTSSVVLQTSSNEPNTRYRWSNGDTTSTITVTTAGNYTVRVGIGNCFSTQSLAFSVTTGTQPARPTVQSGGGNSICPGGTLILTTPVASSYLWSTGATTRSITVNRGGRYWVRVSQGGSCLSDTSVNFRVNELAKPLPVPAQANGNTSICSGDSVRLSAPVGYTFYRWSNGATTREIFVKTAGRYWVSVSQNGNCYSDSLTGFQVSGITAYPSGATANDSIYLWLDPSRTCPLPSVNAAQSMATASIVRLHSGITLGANAWQNTVSTTTAAVEPITRFRNVSGRWIKSILPRNYYGLSQADNATALNFVLNGDAPTGGWFAREGKVEPNCADFTIPLPIPNNVGVNPFAVAVTVNPTPLRPIITATGDTNLCSGQTVVLSAPLGAGYLWNNGATTRTITVGQAGLYSVRLISGTCTSAISRTVQVRVNTTPTAPTISPSGPTSFCSGDSVILSVPAGNNYIWSNGSTSNRLIIKNNANLTVRQIAGTCTSATSNPINVVVNPIPQRPTYSISGNVLTLTSSTVGLSIQWLLNGNPIPNATSNTYTVTQNGAYSVRVTTTAGCTNTSVSNVVTELASAMDYSLGISIAPNPASSTVQLTGKLDQEINLKIFTTNGKEVSSISPYNKANQSIDCSALSSGVYFIQIQGSTGNQVIKLLKQ